MSPTRLVTPRSAAVQAALDRLWAELGQRVRTERLGRGWSIQALAERAGVSRWAVYLIERGEPSSLEVAVRCLGALNLRLDLDILDPRKRNRLAGTCTEDPVHAAMGELEAGHLRKLGYSVATQFPNFQEAAGSFNAERAYLAPILAERVGVRRFECVVHVMVCLWSSEVPHAIRLHPQTFRALAPDPPAGFETWWRGRSPPPGTTSTLVLLDPAVRGRNRPWVDLETALAGARPRYRGYAEAAAALAPNSA